MLRGYDPELLPSSRLTDIIATTLSDNVEPLQLRNSNESTNTSSSFSSVQTYSNINGQTKQSSKINQKTLSKDENDNTLIDEKMQKSRHENGKVMENTSMHYQLGTGPNRKPFIKVLDKDGNASEMRYLKETSPDKQSKEALAFVEKVRQVKKKRPIKSDEKQRSSAEASKELMAISEHMNRCFDDEPHTSSQCVKASSKTSKATTNKLSKTKSSTSQRATKRQKSAPAKVSSSMHKSNVGAKKPAARKKSSTSKRGATTRK